MRLRIPHPGTGELKSGSNSYVDPRVSVHAKSSSHGAIPAEQRTSCSDWARCRKLIRFGDPYILVLARHLAREFRSHFQRLPLKSQTHRYISFKTGWVSKLNVRSVCEVFLESRFCSPFVPRIGFNFLSISSASSSIITHGTGWAFVLTS